MSSNSHVQLRKVLPGVAVDRATLRDRWQRGELVGLFNLPNEDVFNACADFCEQTDANETLVTFTELNALRQRATRGGTSADLFSLVDDNGIALSDASHPVPVATSTSKNSEKRKAKAEKGKVSNEKPHSCTKSCTAQKCHTKCLSELECVNSQLSSASQSRQALAKQSESLRLEVKKSATATRRANNRVDNEIRHRESVQRKWKEEKERNDVLAANIEKLEEQSSEIVEELSQTKNDLRDERMNVRDLLEEVSQLRQQIAQYEWQQERSLLDEQYGMAARQFQRTQTDHLNQTLLKSALDLSFPPLASQANKNEEANDDDDDDEWH